MILQNIPKWFKLLCMCVTLSMVPILVSIIVLVQFRYWSDAVNALMGKYTPFGLPSNPWLDFLPIFVPMVFLFALLSWFAAIAAGSSLQSTVKLILSVLLSLVASMAFGFSMVLALNSYIWFQGLPVIGMQGSPAQFWFPFCFSFAVLLMICYRMGNLT